MLQNISYLYIQKMEELYQVSVNKIHIMLYKLVLQLCDKYLYYTKKKVTKQIIWPLNKPIQKEEALL